MFSKQPVWYIAEVHSWHGMYLRLKSGYIAEDLWVEDGKHYAKLQGKPVDLAYRVYPSRVDAYVVLKELRSFVRRVRGIISLELSTGGATIMEEDK